MLVHFSFFLKSTFVTLCCATPRNLDDTGGMVVGAGGSFAVVASSRGRFNPTVACVFTDSIIVFLLPCVDSKLPQYSI